MSLVKTIKAMVDEGYTISFSKANLPVDGFILSLKKTESIPGKLFQKMN